MPPHKQKTPRTKINLLILTYIAFVTQGLPIGFLSVAWPTIRADFSLPLDAMGLLLISSTTGYSLASFFIAQLVNCFGIGALAGFGSGIMDAGLNTYLAARYKENEMEWLHAYMSVDATFNPIIMTVGLSQFTSWYPAYIFVSILMVVIAGLLVHLFRLESAKTNLCNRRVNSGGRSWFDRFSDLCLEKPASSAEVDPHPFVPDLCRC